MRRLVKFDLGGIPYVNTDFTEILQNEHIKCYSGLLDAMNHKTYEGRNNGIILKGCEIIESSPSSYSMSFYDSMIYLDGEFYQFNDNSQSYVDILSDTFYLYVSGTSSESRYLRDLTTQTDVVETAYFTWSTSEPVTGNYIKFSNQGTSRYFRRIYKYYTSRSGDIYISSSTSSFSATGLGFNDMEGFLLLNENNTNIGPDLSGKFLRGFSINSEPVFTEFGVATVSLTLPQLATHSHSLLATTYSMKHLHMVNTSMYYWPWLRGQWHDGFPLAQPEANNQGSSPVTEADRTIEAAVSNLSQGGDGTQELLRLEHDGSIDTVNGKLSWADTPNNGSSGDTNFMRTKEYDVTTGGDMTVTSNGQATWIGQYTLQRRQNFSATTAWDDAYFRRIIDLGFVTSDLNSLNRGTTIAQYGRLYATNRHIFVNTLTTTRKIKVTWSEINTIIKFTGCHPTNSSSATMNFIMVIAHRKNNGADLVTAINPGGPSPTIPCSPSQQTNWNIPAGSSHTGNDGFNMGPGDSLLIYFLWGSNGTVKPQTPTAVAAIATIGISNYYTINLSEYVNVGTTNTEPSTKINYYTHGISDANSIINSQTPVSNWNTTFDTNNLATHSHTFSSGPYSGTGVLGTDGLPHDNRPEYKVMAYYTKKYDFQWRG